MKWGGHPWVLLAVLAALPCLSAGPEFPHEISAGAAAQRVCQDLQCEGRTGVPEIIIKSPKHNAWLPEGPEVLLDVEVRGVTMGVEECCAVVYVNTQYRHKQCQQAFQIVLGGLRSGLSVVEVAILDERDRELPVFGSASFTLSNEPPPPTHSSVPSNVRGKGRRLLVTYATDAFKDAARLLAVSAFKIGGLDGVVTHGPEHINGAFAQQHSRILSRRKGAGLWLWKPYLLNKTLHSLDDGDVVMYADAQLSFVASAAPLFALAEQEPSGVVSFEMAQHKERKFTKAAAFARIGCTSDSACRDTGQRAATFILFQNGAESRRFVEEWLGLCTEEALISDDEGEWEGEDDDFAAHRHDQSIYSLLCKWQGIQGYRIPTQYGLEEAEQGMPGEYGQILKAK